MDRLQISSDLAFLLGTTKKQDIITVYQSCYRMLIRHHSVLIYCIAKSVVTDDDELVLHGIMLAMFRSLVGSSFARPDGLRIALLICFMASIRRIVGGMLAKQ